MTDQNGPERINLSGPDGRDIYSFVTYGTKSHIPTVLSTEDAPEVVSGFVQTIDRACANSISTVEWDGILRLEVQRADRGAPLPAGTTIEITPFVPTAVVAEVQETQLTILGMLKTLWRLHAKHNQPELRNGEQALTVHSPNGDHDTTLQIALYSNPLTGATSATVEGTEEFNGGRLVAWQSRVLDADELTEYIGHVNALLQAPHGTTKRVTHNEVLERTQQIHCEIIEGREALLFAEQAVSAFQEGLQQDMTLEKLADRNKTNTTTRYFDRGYDWSLLYTQDTVRRHEDNPKLLHITFNFVLNSDLLHRQRLPRGIYAYLDIMYDLATHRPLSARIEYYHSPLEAGADAQEPAALAPTARWEVSEEALRGFRPILPDDPYVYAI